MNGMWDLFYLTEPLNKDNKWDLILHQSIFSLDYVKRHIKSLQRGSKEDQYIVHILMWSGVYLSSTFPNALLKRLPALVPLKATLPEIFVATMTTFISNSYDAVEDTLTHTKSLKLKNYPGKNVTDC